MSIDIFDQKDTVREKILIFKSSINSSINYHTTDKYEIYIIGNFQPFKSYISNLIDTASINLSVIVMFESFMEFFLLLQFLSKFDKFKPDYKKKFLQDYGNFMKQSQGTDEDTENISLILDKSQCNNPLSFNFTVILNSGKYQDYSSTSDILTQQYVRFVTMIHGGNVIATSELDIIISNPQYLLNIDHSPQSTFSEENIFNIKELPISLYIPRGWDSRNMIKILGKSIISRDREKLLLQDEDFDFFELSYDNFLSSEAGSIAPPIPDVQSQDKNYIVNDKIPKTMTWKDLLANAIE